MFIALKHVTRGGLLCPIFGASRKVFYLVDCFDEDEFLHIFQCYLRTPRSFNGPVRTTVGDITLLTFVRYRICELFAPELLHCSNMALLNRPPEFSHFYDAEGRMHGGLSALVELARVIALNSGEERDRDVAMRSQDEIVLARELPLTNSVHIPGGDDGGAWDGGGPHGDVVPYLCAPATDATAINAPATSEPPLSPLLQEPPHLVPSSPNPASLPSPTEIALSLKSPEPSPEASASGSTTSLCSHSSKRNSRRIAHASPAPDAPLPVGELLKDRFVELNIASTLLDLFFEFPWKNFLHSVVYDFIHQTLTGNVDGRLGRELAVALFHDARLMHRIVEGQRTLVFIATVRT
ncbi:SIT4 phosphatase-associated protein family [Mycena leptocephala]|nr:SIT4 phosphatase-associated protein family [Mycena leptocephala]